MIETPGYFDQLDQQNDKVLSHYRKVQASFTEVLVEARKGAKDNERITSRLSEMEADMRAMPELLEHVLMQADVGDVLRMCQVSRKFKAIVDNSPSLQIMLCLTPAKSSTVRTTPFQLGFPGFTVHITNEGDGTFPLEAVRAEFNLLGSDRKFPSIGDAWKRMLICQPPVKEMFGGLRCSEHRQFTHASNAVRITSKTGLTIGDLYDKAAPMLPEDRTGCSCNAFWSGVERKGSGGVHFVTVEGDDTGTATLIEWG